MTKEELQAFFNSECTDTDKNGNPIVRGTPTEIINRISAKFCEPDHNNTSTPFSKAFTGMRDKNANPIHEGDQVRLYYKGEYVVCTVVYDTSHAAFFIKWPDGYVNHYFMNGNSYEVVTDKK